MRLLSRTVFGETSSRGQVIAIVLLVVLIIAIGYSTVFRSGPHEIFHKQWGSLMHRCDLSVYTAAGEAVLQRRDIYTAHNSRGWYYVYPPPFALMMAPFALVPLFWASLVWYVLSVLMIACAARTSFSMMIDYGHSPKKIFWYVLISLLLVSWPLVSALERGQSTPVLLLLVMLALAGAQDGRDWRGGIALGGAILLKAFPVLLLAYFAWRRRWRFVAATAATLAVGWALPAIIYGWRQNLSLWSEWFSRVMLPASSKESAQRGFALYSTLLDRDIINNQSLSAVLFRLTGLGDSRLLATTILIGMAAVMILVWRRYRSGNEHVILSAVTAWMLLASPISWAHYFMLLLFPLMVLISSAESGQDRTKCNIVRGALAIFAVCCLGGAVKYFQLLGILCWGTVIIWGVLVYIAAEYSAPPAAQQLPPNQTY